MQQETTSAKEPPTHYPSPLRHGCALELLARVFVFDGAGGSPFGGGMGARDTEMGNQGWVVVDVASTVRVVLVCFPRSMRSGADGCVDWVVGLLTPADGLLHLHNRRLVRVPLCCGVLAMCCSARRRIRLHVNC